MCNNGLNILGEDAGRLAEQRREQVIGEPIQGGRLAVDTGYVGDANSVGHRTELDRWGQSRLPHRGRVRKNLDRIGLFAVGAQANRKVEEVVIATDGGDDLVARHEPSIGLPEYLGGIDGGVDPEYGVDEEPHRMAGMPRDDTALVDDRAAAALDKGTEIRDMCVQCVESDSREWHANSLPHQGTRMLDRPGPKRARRTPVPSYSRRQSRREGGHTEGALRHAPIARRRRDLRS